MSTTGNVIDGILKSDGTLVLNAPPSLPPGPVRVTVQPLSDERERLPDEPWLNDAIPAPFDLPRFGAVVLVNPRTDVERLPELLFDIEESPQ